MICTCGILIIFCYYFYLPNLVEIIMRMMYTPVKEVMTVIALDANQKYYTTSELKDMGYSYYKIGQLEENGRLHHINRTTYENLSYKGDENDFINAAAYVPEGVICLMSAARYYELTNFLPDVIDVAIDRKKKVSTLPDWPQIKIFYFDPSRMDTGVTKITEGGDSFRIFDIEKTVVDIIYYRNKIGIEETSEVLRNYLKRKDRQPMPFGCSLRNAVHIFPNNFHTAGSHYENCSGQVFFYYGIYCLGQFIMESKRDIMSIQSQYGAPAGSAAKIRVLRGLFLQIEAAFCRADY